MAHVDLSEVFENVGWGDIPESIIDLMQAIPLWHPDDEDTDDEDRQGQQTVYNRILNGHCMTCDGVLGETTMVTIASAGIVMVYCGGACYTDMQVLGWLEEQYLDTVDQIKFRGGKGDQPESS